MKKILGMMALAIAGVGVGGAAAYGTGLLLGPAETAPQAEAIAFVTAGKVLAPLAFPDGRLAGYVSFEVHLDVPEERRDWVSARMPLLLNAINMRTYKAPIASGPDGLVPNLNVFRAVVVEASTEAFGRGTVRQVALTQAEPA